MFIPTNYSKSPEVGDKILLKEKIYVHGGFFTEGHIFKIVSKNEKYYSLIDDDGNKVDDVSDDIITPIINLYEASKDLDFTENKCKKLELIKYYCKYKGNAWDEYMHFYSCNLNGKGYGRNAEDCNPKLECEQYCDKIKLRSHKLNFINIID